MQNGIPQRIANYDVERRLGRGNMGTVYLARDRDLGRHVAIKVIQADIDSADIRERFNREARSIAALNHPNIVTLYHAGQEESLPYLVLEHIDGRSVLHIISKREAVPLAQRLLWIEQLCEGLQYAHERGIIHRDIKPANLMIDHLNRLRILDFGIARIFGEARTQMSTLIGTPAYMAPEYIRGEGIDARADVFAAGAVAYELLSYQRAFAGDTQSTILHRVLSEMPAHFADAGGTNLDPEFEDVVFRALSKDPNGRFQTAREFADAIRSLRGRVDVSAEAWAKPGTGVATVAIETKDVTRESSLAGSGVVADSGALAADPGTFAPTQVVESRSTTDMRAAAQSLALDEEPLPFEPTLLAGTTRSDTLGADTRSKSSNETHAAMSPPSNTWRYVAIAAGVVIIAAAVVTGLLYFAEPTINTNGVATTTTPGDSPAPPGPIVPAPAPPVAASAGTGTGTIEVGKSTNGVGSKADSPNVVTAPGNKPIVPDTGGKEAEGVPVRTAYDLFNGSSGPALPGLIYRILQRTNGGSSVVSVDPRDTVFRTGRDQFRFAFRSNMDGYLYVAQKSDQGDWDVVFPEPGVNGGSNRVQKDQDYIAPSPDWFQLDPPSGTESVFVFLSKKPVGAFNDLNRPVTSQATLSQSEIDKLTSTISMRKLVVAKGDVPAAAAGSGGSAVYVVNADAFADAVMVTFDMTHK